MTRQALLTITVAFAANAAATALAGEERDAAFYTAQFERWSGTVGDLEQADPEAAVVKEIEMIRTLVGQGQAFLAAERLEDIDPVLERVEAVELFVRAKLERLSAEANAARAENEARAAAARAEKATAAAEAAATRFGELEAQGL